VSSANASLRPIGKGSRVNVVGRLRNNNYTDGQGSEVYGMSFTCEELDYLDSKTESQARKGRQEWAESYEREQASAADKAKPGRAPRTVGQGRGAAAN
jgi:single-strand DNA-binding protein